ncbi:MAG: KH domain-containing protein [Bacilli bacterium]|nr:KH domain-containing protein [Bacilli bacterium]
MVFEKIIHTIVDPILINPEALMIREIPGTSEEDITILIVSESEDTARLIGKKGSVANALREIVAVAGKSEGKHIHLKFESFDEESK